MYLAVLIMCVSFAGIWTFLPSEIKQVTTLDKQPLRPFGTYELIGKVPVVEWTGNNLIQYATKHHTPVVFRNTFVKHWKALSKWTPEYLSRNLGELEGVYVHSKKLFGPYYDDTRPMASLETVKRDSRAYKTTNMTAREFWQKTLSLKEQHQQQTQHAHHQQKKPKTRYVYYAANIESQPSLLSDVDPIVPLMFNSADQQNVNVWFGGNNVATHTHYDSYHNLYVQIYGTKKWLLFPPSEASHLYVYPFLHPSHAQLQVNVHDASEASHYPNLRQAKAVEVTIHPGEVLYLPPMWFHYVEAGDISISVNSWSFSDQSDIMEQVYAVDLPFDAPEFDDDQFRAGAVAVYLRMLARKTHLADNFFYMLYTTRYEGLIEDKIIPSLHPHCDVKKGYDDTPEVPRKIMNSFKDKVHATAFLLMKIPQDTREIWLMNYVEFIISLSSGVDHVGSYLKQCIPYPPLE